MYKRQKSHRQQALLSYLVKETLAGNAQRLKGYTLGVEIFGRGTDFDPATDAIVRVEVGRLRIKLREYNQLYGQSEAVLFELPKGGYSVDIHWRDRSATPISTPVISRQAWPNSLEHAASLAVLPFSNLGSNPEQEYFVDGIVDNLIFELSRLSGLFVISRQSVSYTHLDVYKRQTSGGMLIGPPSPMTVKPLAVCSTPFSLTFSEPLRV